MLTAFILFQICSSFTNINAQNTAENITLNGQGKVFSLFNIVEFPNDVCTTSSDSSMYGTCYTKSECSSKGGTADGNCASGFGVCCMFSLSTCGSTVSENRTYIQNPSYPSSYSTSGTCSYSVSRLNDVCQLRLDFSTLALYVLTADSGTILAGECADTTTDGFTATSPTGVSPPTVCGSSLDGQHMYVETGTSSSITLSFSIGTGTFSRKWKIEVNQIECNTNYKAPEGCVQYFTGISGTVKSYNHAGGQGLNTQSYTSCIRTEEGYCGATYAQSSTSSPDAFQFSTPTASENTPGGCIVASVNIPGGIGKATATQAAITPGCNPGFGCAETPVENFCGAYLSSADAVPAASPVTTFQQPLKIGFFADVATQASSTGFNINYSQLPC